MGADRDHSLEPPLTDLEREVFDWLLARPAVAVAVKLACGGRQADAEVAIECELEELLGPAERGCAASEPALGEEQPVVPAEQAGVACEAAPRADQDHGGREPASKRPRLAEADPAVAGQWLARSQRLLEADTARSAERARSLELAGSTQEREHMPMVAPLYWKIDLPGVSKVFAQRGILPAERTPVEHPHATLLYIGGSSDDHQAASLSNLPLEQFRSMRKALEALQGSTVEVRITEVVVEESVACARVSLPPGVPCANEVPHVTLWTKVGVPARYSNEVLEELKAGRTEGITRVPLPVPKCFKGKITIEHASGVSSKTKQV
uniref:tRNA ligase phosphodiesterase domain-containing protein n=1 Tax=Alexandrium monilatum TaxID=311494 RepID=A0A7S4QN42_9DINO